MNELQKNLFKAAISNDPPFLTTDPVVNHAVDQHVQDFMLEYDELQYRKEIDEAVEAPRGLLTFIYGNDKEGYVFRAKLRDHLRFRIEQCRYHQETARKAG